MVKNDFTWMAENRDRILAEWSKRYEFESRTEEVTGRSRLPGLAPGSQLADHSHAGNEHSLKVGTRDD